MNIPSFLSKHPHSDFSIHDYALHLPLIGTTFGALAGIAARFRLEIATDYKNPELYHLHCKGIVKRINDLKQWEIKNCALLLPFIPIIAALAYRTFQSWREDKENKKFHAHLFTHIRRLPQEALISTGITLALSFAVNHSISMSTDWLREFNPSGHMILKIALSKLFQKTTKAALQLKSVEKRVCALFAAAIAVTDALLLYHTSLYCHTVVEVLSGAFIGWIICRAGSRLAALPPVKATQVGF